MDVGGEVGEALEAEVAASRYWSISIVGSKSKS